MKKLFLFLLLASSAIYPTGCATIITGKYQNIPVTSEPPGVKVRSSTGEYITTPGSFNLVRNQDHTLLAEYPGSESQQVQLKHGLQGWFWGNILLGGIIGGVVDLASGSCDKLLPKKVHFDFTKAGQAIASRRNSYLDEHPDTKEEIAFAIMHGISAKGMTKQELTASLGEPTRIEDSGNYEDFIYENQEPSTYYFKNGLLAEAK